MPEKKTIERAREDKRRGKSPSTQAGEFVHEEIEHIRAGKHGARSTKQAIAIGLSKARRAGVRLPPPKKGAVPEWTRKSAVRAYARGKTRRSISPARSRATREALRHEGHGAASRSALARQARRSAARRSAADRSRSALEGARKRSPSERHRAALKAARTRARRSKRSS